MGVIIDNVLCIAIQSNLSLVSFQAAEREKAQLTTNESTRVTGDTETVYSPNTGK